MSDAQKESAPEESGKETGELRDPEENGKEPEEEKSSDNNVIGSLEPEVMKNLPPEARKVLQFGMSMSRVGPMPNPLVEKINDKHIDKLLEITEKDDERSFKDAGETRKFTLAYVLIFVGLVVFLTIYLGGHDRELYKEIMKLFAVFAGGLGSGFGIKSYIDRNK